MAFFLKKIDDRLAKQGLTRRRYFFGSYNPLLQEGDLPFATNDILAGLGYIDLFVEIRPEVPALSKRQMFIFS